MKLVIGDRRKTSDKQIAFFKARAKHIGYGGARGGGKSWAIRAKAKMLAMRYPGIKMLIVRRTYQELRNNHIVFLRTELHGAAKYNTTDKIFTFSNGSTLAFGYCANDGDLDQYQGAEYDVIFLDEATQLREEWIKKITACLRGANSFPKRIYYTCNPGGASHGYFKRLFIDRRYEDGEKAEDYTFIQALVQDNIALMESQPDYIQQLEALPPKLREAWLYGRWDVYEGQFFEDFRAVPDVQLCTKAGITVEEAMEQHRFTHVIEPFDLNAGERRGWKILRGYDFGYSKPFSCAWYALDYDGTMYRILEMYGCTGEPNEGVRWSPDEQFRKIREIESTHPWLQGRSIDGIADPAIWDAETGISIAQMAAGHQVYFRKGDHTRITGWMQCHYRMQFDDRGYARFYCFSTCKEFIRTIPLMMYDKNHPEDLDTKLEDHIADEWRYVCMSRPVAPMRKVQQAGYQVFTDPLNQIKEENYGQ